LISVFLTHPYLTLPLGWMSPVDDIQCSDHQVGPLSFPDKQEAREISQKLWQASGVCYQDRYNPYGKNLREE